MLKFNVREILDRHQIEHIINNADMTTAKGQSADIVITTPDLLHAIEGAKGFRKILILENLVSKTELESKLIPACQELLQSS